MAAFGYGEQREVNTTLQTSEEEVLKVKDLLSEGTTLRVGCLVKVGANDSHILPAGADDLTVIGQIIGFWDANAVYTPTPGAAIASAELKCRVAYKQSGVISIFLLPNTVAATRGVKLKPAASGRVTLLAGTPTVTDALAYSVDALEALTAGADDAFVLGRWA